MTVNERLFAAKLLSAFDAAVRRRQRAEMIALLERVELTSTEAGVTADAILAAPSRYGF